MPLSKLLTALPMGAYQLEIPRVVVIASQQPVPS